MTTRHEQLAKKLRTQRTLTVVALGIFSALTIGAVAWVTAMPAMAEREAFNIVKEDFEKTWCATYGVDPTDPGLELWQAFADRNRTYMGENWQNYAVTNTNLDGSSTFKLYIDMAIEESRLGYYNSNMEQFWFGDYLSSSLYLFEFDGTYGSPPSC